MNVFGKRRVGLQLAIIAFFASTHLIAQSTRATRTEPGYGIWIQMPDAWKLGYLMGYPDSEQL